MYKQYTKFCKNMHKTFQSVLSEKQVTMRKKKYKKDKNPSLTDIPFKMRTILRKNPDNLEKEFQDEII